MRAERPRVGQHGGRVQTYGGLQLAARNLRRSAITWLEIVFRSNRSVCREVWQLVQVVIVLSFLPVCEIVCGVECRKQLHFGLSLPSAVIGWPSPPHSVRVSRRCSCVLRVSARLLEPRLRGRALGTDLPDQKAENA